MFYRRSMVSICQKCECEVIGCCVLFHNIFHLSLVYSPNFFFQVNVSLCLKTITQVFHRNNYVFYCSTLLTMPKKSVKKPISDEDCDDETYRRRRDRNNQAVKRSRFKSKQKTLETLERISKLKTENESLEDKVKTLTKELSFLKELFLAQAANNNSSLTDKELVKILSEESDEQASKS